MKRFAFAAAIALVSASAFANKPGDIPIPPGYDYPGIMWIHAGSTEAMNYYYAMRPLRGDYIYLTLLTGTRSVSGGYSEEQADDINLHCNAAHLPDQAILDRGLTINPGVYAYQAGPEVSEIQLMPGTLLAQVAIAACKHH